VVVSRLFVNEEGNANIAFTERDTTLAVAACEPGSKVDAARIVVTRNDKLVHWQIHPDGTYRNTVVEALSGEQSLSAPVTLVLPTRSIVTDNMKGTLIPVQRSRRPAWESGAITTEDFVYRLDPVGNLVYRFALPPYSGALQDEMVLGGNDLAFLTRGSLLVAFHQRIGSELWRWDSHTAGISVFAALANGNCAVQTPTALIEVGNGVEPKVLVNGKAMMDWLGNTYIKPY
jgi:hypothetical protein